MSDFVSLDEELYFISWILVRHIKKEIYKVWENNKMQLFRTEKNFLENFF